jgi:hypothetical protein
VIALECQQSRGLRRFFVLSNKFWQFYYRGREDVFFKSVDFIEKKLHASFGKALATIEGRVRLMVL